MVNIQASFGDVAQGIPLPADVAPASWANSSAACSGSWANFVDRATLTRDMRQIMHWIEEAFTQERISMCSTLERRHRCVMHGLNLRFASTLQGNSVPEVENSLPQPSWAPSSPRLFDVADKARSVTVMESTASLDGNGIIASVALPSVLDKPKGVIASTSDSDKQDPKPKLNRFKAFVTSISFEVVFGILIILNAMILAMQMEYDGFNNAHALGYQNSSRTAAETWPGAHQVFNACEWLFGMIFAAEVCLKIVALRKDFFSCWNTFDLFVVFVWMFDRINVQKTVINPMILRMGRLWRVVRLLRIMRWTSVFAPLTFIIKSIRASMSVLIWSLLLLVLVVSIIGMFVSQVLQDFIQAADNDVEARILVFESWGTFTRATVTMFEITLANWAPPCRLLMNVVNEWWALFFIVYKCSIGFSVVQVITSVFIQQTFKVASRDEDVMVHDKKAEAKAYLKHLEDLFKKLDTSGDGVVSRVEFESVLQDVEVRHLFAAMGIDVSEASQLFQVLDDGDGVMEVNEFIDAMKLVKGDAKGTHMIMLMRAFRKLEKSVSSKMCRVVSSSMSVGVACGLRGREYAASPLPQAADHM